MQALHSSFLLGQVRLWREQTGGTRWQSEHVIQQTVGWQLQGSEAKFVLQIFYDMLNANHHETKNSLEQLSSSQNKMCFMRKMDLKKKRSTRDSCGSCETFFFRLYILYWKYCPVYLSLTLLVARRNWCDSHSALTELPVSISCSCWHIKPKTPLAEGREKAFQQ